MPPTNSNVSVKKYIPVNVMKCYQSVNYHYYRKISIFQSLFINFPVSQSVDKAYKVILGLIFGSTWTITSFDRMRKTDMQRVKCLRGL